MPRPSLVTIWLLLLASTQPAIAGKKSHVGRRVPASQRVSIDQIDHQTWNSILGKYVDNDGMVNYRALKASAGDRRLLDQYLATLSTANPNAKARREAKLAYWINAYNAVTLRGILKEYPTQSIRNHTAKLVGYNIWHDYQLLVADKAYSLDQMEHQILRKMNEPRIHFAIVCASVGCPRLLPEAYVPERLDEQLEQNAKDFFSRPRNFRHDPARKQFYLSEIMSWFATDFGPNQGVQLKAISRWLPTREAQNAATQNAVRIRFLDYDWNLNEQKKTATPPRYR